MLVRIRHQVGQPGLVMHRNPHCRCGARSDPIGLPEKATRVEITNIEDVVERRVRTNRVEFRRRFLTTMFR